MFPSTDFQKSCPPPPAALYLIHEKIRSCKNRNPLIWLAAVLLFFSTLMPDALLAQPCTPESEFTIQVVGSDIVFTANMPNIPGATYTWGVSDDNGQITEVTGPTTLTLSQSLFSLTSPIYVRLFVESDFVFSQCYEEVYAGDGCGEVIGDLINDVMGCTVNFEPVYGLPIPPVSIIGNTWNFGDGSPEIYNEPSPTHLFPSSGTYTVFHAVITDWGEPEITRIYWCSDDVTVSCGSSFTCDFDLMEQDDCCRLNIYFESDFQDGIHSWDFGDGTPISNEVNPVHQYTNLNTSVTPSVAITHTITYQGTTLACSKTHTFEQEHQGIYVGMPGVQTSMNNVVSSIDGQLLFPGTDMMGENIHIDGELNSDKDFFTLNNCHVCMIPRAGINLGKDNSPFAKELRIGNMSEVSNSDQQMCAVWRSIRVDDNGRLGLFNSTIKDAYYGVETVGESIVLQVNNTNFNNNFVGMYLQGNVSTPLFRGNTFAFDGTMLDPIGGLPDNFPYTPGYNTNRSYAGIQTNETVLNLFDYNPIIPPNLFTNLAQGIAMNNTHAIIHRCRFEDIEAGPYDFIAGNGILFESDGGHSLQQLGILPSPFDPTPITFNGCTTGIKLLFSGPQIQLRSQNNVMENMGTGYFLRATSEGSLGVNEEIPAIITNNTITAIGRGIQTILSSPTSYLDVISNDVTTLGLGNDVGIWIMNDPIGLISAHDILISQNNVIQYNNLTSPSLGIFLSSVDGGIVELNNVQMSLSTTQGISIWHSENCTVSCNKITGDGDRGLSLLSSQSCHFLNNGSSLCSEGFNVSFENPGTIINCNKFSDNTYGLLFDNLASTGNQLDYRNVWEGTFWLGALHTDPGIASLSQFSRANSNNQTPPSWEPFNWFILDDPIICNICPEEMLIEPTSFFDALDTLTVTNGLEVGTYSEGYNWNLQRHLFRKIDKHPSSVFTNTTMYDFVNTYSNTSGGFLYDIEKQISELFNLTPSNHETIESNSLSSQSLLNDIYETDSLIKIAINNNNNLASFLVDRSNLFEQLQTLQQESSLIIQGYITNRLNVANDLINANDTIITVADYESNEKTINDILLKTEVQNAPPMLTQIETIESISEMCPLEGGNAVYRANALLLAWTNQFNKINTCGANPYDDNEDSEKPTITGQKLKVFPNPSRESARLLLPYMEGGDGYLLKVTNVTGQTVFSVQLPANSYKYDLLTSTFPAGIYQVHLIGVSTSDVISAKIIIQH